MSLSWRDALLLPPNETKEIDTCHIGSHNHDDPKHDPFSFSLSMSPVVITSLTGY